MFSNGYVGTAEDGVRIRRQEKEREKEKKKFETAAAEKHKEAQQAGLKQFAATTSEALEHAFKNETVGLVTKADFVKKRTTLQERIEEELRRKQQAEERVVAEEKERKRRDKMNARAGKLSFMAAGDDDDGGEEGEPSAPPSFSFKLPKAPSTAAAADGPAQGEGTGGVQGGVQGADAQGSVQGEGSLPSPSSAGGEALPDSKRIKKVGKNPTVATDFLPDRDRARLEEELRVQLRKEWQSEQDKIKSEPLMIVYSYWDGSGHRREIKAKKGDTIGIFLKAVKEQLMSDFRELRHVSVDNLLYVKEDIILPHHHTFHELIINKARGKSGPLFDFGVHEDIRVVNDASREKNESHAGKVVERHWYDRNKHIFPASRWEIYDPEKKHDTYTIYGE